MSRHITLLSILMLALLSASCREQEVEPEFGPEQASATHTVLMYLNGDNDISRSIQSNEDDAQKALCDSVLLGAINLVVFNDNPYLKGDCAKLYWIRRTGKKTVDKSGIDQGYELDTVPLLTFEPNTNALSVEVLSKVVKTTFSRFDTPIKGMTFCGHGLGYYPSPSFVPASAPIRNEVEWIGVDSNNETQTKQMMELWKFREALEQAGVTLDYIIFDCCHMGGIETAYECRNLTHYMVAAPTEIEGDGFPYQTVITRLSQVQNVSQLPQTLDYCAHSYFDRYKKRSYGATISLFDLTYAEDLAVECASLINSSPVQETYADVANYKQSELKKWLSNFQPYGRSAKNTQYHFYDVKQHLDFLNTDTQRLHEMLDKVVLNHYYTPKYHEIEINDCCGFSMAITPSFRLAEHHRYVTEAYRKTMFGQLSDQ